MPVNEAKQLAADVYPKVFRTDFSQQGFTLINQGSDYGSERQRQFMVELKGEFDQLEQKHRGRHLVYQSLGRFDQQVTTKPHRDGGPEESILILGYEPTMIESRVSLSDYSLCAREMGLTPFEFLDQYNPLFADGQERLAKYSTAVTDFDNTCFQVLIINNSLTSVGENRLLGVLHTAEIINPDSGFMRVVNSTMIASESEYSDGGISANEKRAFVFTDIVRRASNG
jgi:hypothetical protein